MLIQLYTMTIKGGAQRWFIQCVHQGAALQGGQRVVPVINGYRTIEEAKLDAEILKAGIGSSEVVVIGESP